MRPDVLHGGTESLTGRRHGAVDDVGRTSDATPATCPDGEGDCRQVVAFTIREGDALGAALGRFEAVLRRDGPRIEPTTRGPR